MSTSVDALTSLEALQAPYCWDFRDAPSQRHDQLLTSLPVPLPCLEDEGCGWKFPAASSFLLSLGIKFLFTLDRTKIEDSVNLVFMKPNLS